MQIDPKTQTIITVVLAALGFIASMSPSMFPGYIPAGAASDIVKTAGLVDAFAMSIATALGLYSSSKPGLLAPPDPPVVAAATRLVAATTTAEVISAKTDLNIEVAKH